MNVEKEAVDYVIKYEKKHKRNPKDVSKNRVGYDILSDGRQIEVKGLGSRNPFVLYNINNIKALQKEKNYWLYVVFDVKTKPKLLKLPKYEVLKNLHFEISGYIPLRKADFEKGKF